MDFSKILSTWWSGNCYHLEQLDAIIHSPDVKSYAYILHDKCKNENGELKKPHYHFLIQMNKNQRGSWFKAFATEDMGIVFYEPTRDPAHLFNYLIHDTDKCRKEQKHLYDPTERISTIDDFTGDIKENEQNELFDDIEKLVERKMSWHEFLKKKPKRIHMIGHISKATELIRSERYPQFDEYAHRPSQHYDPRPIPRPLPPTNRIDKSTGELIPITDKKILDDMPF